MPAEVTRNAPCASLSAAALPMLALRFVAARRVTPPALSNTKLPVSEFPPSVSVEPSSRMLTYGPPGSVSSVGVVPIRNDSVTGAAPVFTAMSIAPPEKPTPVIPSEQLRGGDRDAGGDAGRRHDDLAGSVGDRQRADLEQVGRRRRVDDGDLHDRSARRPRACFEREVALQRLTRDLELDVRAADPHEARRAGGVDLRLDRGSNRDEELHGRQRQRGRAREVAGDPRCAERERAARAGDRGDAAGEVEARVGDGERDQRRSTT